MERVISDKSLTNIFNFDVAAKSGLDRLIQGAALVTFSSIAKGVLGASSTKILGAMLGGGTLMAGIFAIGMLFRQVMGSSTPRQEIKEELKDAESKTEGRYDWMHAIFEEELARRNNS